MEFLTILGLGLLILLGAFFILILLNTLNEFLKMRIAMYRRKKLVRVREKT